MNKDIGMDTPTALRWGYSTGACAAALATAAWLRLQDPDRICSEIRLLFLDGKERILPLLPAYHKAMVAIRKDGGDDPDCTDGAILFGRMKPTYSCKAEGKADTEVMPDVGSEARPEDYVLPVGKATLIVRAIAGIGLCTRLGLDCEQGKWAINTGPQQMIVNNLQRVGMTQGSWLFEFGVEHGAKLAKHTLNAHLGILGGISILGTTGLVHPYSHDAYIETIRLCVRSNHLSGRTSMVFCTGGRTKSGAKRYLPSLPETAFTCIGDFIAESLVTACQYGMQEIIVACMPGKLCKYAAGFANTHAHKANQNMQLLLNEVQKYLPDEVALHEALTHSVSVREALLSIPKTIRLAVLHSLALAALKHFAKHCGQAPLLRILVFDFSGHFLFEKTYQPPQACTGNTITTSTISSMNITICPGQSDLLMSVKKEIIAEEAITETYFLKKSTI